MRAGDRKSILTRRPPSWWLGRSVALALAMAALGAVFPSAPHALKEVARPPASGVSPTSVSLVSPTGLVYPAFPGTVIAHGRRDVPMVALTFDSNLTPAMIAELRRGSVASFDNRTVIDELDTDQVPATFFLAGLWVEHYPDETRRLAADPLFEIGSHSYAHRGFAPGCYRLGTLPVDAMADDVTHSEQLLRSFTASPTPYFRFPGGCYDGAALAAVAPTGVTVVQYDVASGDAFGTSVRAIVSHTLRAARNGSIVVLHVTGGNTAPLTAQALPAIIDGLRGRGFQLVKLSTLLASCDPAALCTAG